jgi:hypothetical protein
MYNPTPGEQKAIAILKDEISEWQSDHAFVTDEFFYDGQLAVKRARRNYFGVFEEERNPQTGRKKVFIPFTEWTVETVLKNIDIDTKDVEVKAKHPDSYKVAQIFRYVLQYYLNKIHFGKKLNDLLRNTVIDGTAFLKVWKENGEMKLRVVDRLNMTVDPTAPNLDETPVIERNLLTLPEFKEYKWQNLDDVKGSKDLDRTGLNMQSAGHGSQVPYVEVYERYGYFPKFVFTEEEKDEDFVYGRVCYSSNGNSYIVHKMEEVKSHPYQEFKFRDLVNRFDGRGVPEMLFQIQTYLNEIINTRLETSRVAQAGLWDVRGNITPQQFKRLFTTGAIKTSQEGDINRIDTGTVDPSSYKDEEQAYLWGQRVTQTQAEDEIAQSQPATNALIQERGSSKGYNLVMEGIFLALKKVLEEKMVPIICQIIKDNDIIRITGDVKALKELDEQLAQNLAYQKLNDMKNDPVGKMQLEQGVMDMVQQGLPMAEAENQLIEMTKQGIMQDLSTQGEDRFPQMSKKLFDTEFDIGIEIGDEQINKAVIANTLNQAIGILGKVGLPVVEPMKELFDTLGLDAERLTKGMAEAQQQMAAQNAMPAPVGQPSEANMMPKPVQ